MPEINATEETADDSISTITETARDQLSSRRGFLAGTAAVGGASLVGSTGSVVAQEDSDSNNGESSNGDGSSGENNGDEVSDLDILNYALTLEHLENNFYAKGLDDFSDEELMNADVLCDRFCMDARKKVPEYIRVVGEHEAAHVEQITAVIEKLGGDPVAEADYEFGYESPSEFLELSSALENTGVAAYAGAGPEIKNDKIVAAALSIHSVEARHAGTINLYTGKAPFPMAFDEPKSMEEVKEIAGQFIVTE